jgi:hypothetical protein
MPRVAKTKKKGKKPSEKEASGDGDGFETTLSVGVGESTSLNIQRKSPMMARTNSKVAGSKKKTAKAATFTSEEPPSPESVGRKHPPKHLVVLEQQKGTVTTLWQREKPKRVVLTDVPTGKDTGPPPNKKYPFVSSAVRNAFVLCPLHANHAVIEKHMYHLTTLVSMLYSLLKPSIEDFSVVNKIVVQA